MSINCAVIAFGVICLTAVLSSPVTKVDVALDNQVEENAPLILHAYSQSNESGSTFEEIMQEIATRKAKKGEDKADDRHSISKRALGCAQTSIAYGSSTGTAFSDFTTANPWPCGVDITKITVRHGGLIDSLQMTYKTVDQTIINGLQRGGNGGTNTTIVLEDGERITGVSGMTCAHTTGIVGTLVRQLIFFAQKLDGQRVVYGPYGQPTTSNYPSACRMFSVNAKINSIYGRVGTYNDGRFVGLGAIGFYYEDESRGSQNTSN